MTNDQLLMTNYKKNYYDYLLVISNYSLAISN